MGLPVPGASKVAGDRSHLGEHMSRPEHPFVPPPEGSDFGAFFGGGCWYVEPVSVQRCGFPEGAHPIRQVPVTLHSPPGDTEKPPASGTIADTPENRRLLESAAIPRCREWREANPEYVPEGFNEAGTKVLPGGMEPAPYCCSAYCDRCAGLRALDGVEPLTPNEWMTK
jgi:hypothetical protein